MKKLFCSALLMATACCYAEEMDDDLPRFEGAHRAFLVTVTQDIHAYRSEDKLMMEKKAGAVKAISSPKIAPRPFKVKMDVKLKKGGSMIDIKNVQIKKVQVTTKTTF